MKSLSAAAGTLVYVVWLVGCAVDDPMARDTGHVTSSEAAALPDAVGPCPSGDVCMYQNGQQTGAHIEVSAGISITDFTVFKCPQCQNSVDGGNGTFDNQMSSWQNASDVDYCWFPDAIFQGAPHLMKAHTQNTVPADYNDHASSLKSGGC